MRRRREAPQQFAVKQLPQLKRVKNSISQQSAGASRQQAVNVRHDHIWRVSVANQLCLLKLQIKTDQSGVSINPVSQPIRAPAGSLRLRMMKNN